MTNKQLKIAILEADIPIPDVLEKYGTYGDQFISLLSKGGLEKDQADIEKYDVVNESKYPSIAGLSAILITGSRYNAYDDIDWINRLVEFTNQAIENNVRVLGICFGHQILARALGAPVGVSEKGWEVSATDINLTAKGEEIFPELAGRPVNIMQMHRDIVIQPPKNTQVLAYNDMCSVQGLYRPRAIWSVQGHPEFNGDIIRSLVVSRQKLGIFNDNFASDAIKRSAENNDGVTIAKSMVRFLFE